MLKNFRIILISILFLYSCDYTPMYSTNNNKLFNIEILDYEGDRKINSILRLRLKSHKNVNTELFKIKINTTYKKEDIAKSTSGEIESYEVFVSSMFDVNYKDSEKRILIERKFSMKNFNDKFEQKNYENRIKEDIANSIHESLLIKLYNIK